jgi:hypothetical protein
MGNIKLFKRFTVLFVIGIFIVGTCWVLPEDVEARRGRGGTRSSVHRVGNKNVNVNVHGGHRRRGPSIGGAIVTGLVIGSIVAAASVPTTCESMVVNGIAYRHCDGYWYQPQYGGTQVTYIVVNPPQ